MDCILKLLEGQAMIEETVIEIKGSLVSVIILCMKRLTFKRFKIDNFKFYFSKILGVVSYFF